MNNIQIGLVTGFALIALITVAGCGGFIEPDSPTPTASPTQFTSTETATNTDSETPSPTVLSTKTPGFSPAFKQEFFASNYTISIEGNGVNVANSTIDARTETLYLSYEMRDTESDLYTGRERENVSLMYVAMTEIYLERGFDKTWIPKQVNVTVITSDGELYETAYTTFERAKRMIDGEISAKRYLLEYYGTIEPGPANPDYEG